MLRDHEVRQGVERFSHTILRTNTIQLSIVSWVGQPFCNSALASSLASQRSRKALHGISTKRLSQASSLGHSHEDTCDYFRTNPEGCSGRGVARQRGSALMIDYIGHSRYSVDCLKPGLWDLSDVGYLIDSVSFCIILLNAQT